MANFSTQITDRDIHPQTHQRPVDNTTGKLIEKVGGEALDAVAGKIASDLDKNLNKDLTELRSDFADSVLQQTNPDTKATIDKLNSLKEARDQGVLSVAGFKSRVDALTRQAINQMPGRAAEFEEARNALLRNNKTDIEQISNYYANAAKSADNAWKTLLKEATAAGVRTREFTGEYRPFEVLAAETAKGQHRKQVAEVMDQRMQEDAHRMSVEKHGIATTLHYNTVYHAEKHKDDISIINAQVNNIMQSPLSTADKQKELDALKASMRQSQTLRRGKVKDNALNAAEADMSILFENAEKVVQGTYQLQQFERDAALFEAGWQDAYRREDPVRADILMRTETFKAVSGGNIFNVAGATEQGELAGRLIFNGRTIKPTETTLNVEIGKTTKQLAAESASLDNPALKREVDKTTKSYLDNYISDRGETTWSNQDYAVALDVLADDNIIDAVTTDPDTSSTVANMSKNAITDRIMPEFIKEFDKGSMEFHSRSDGTLFVEATDSSAINKAGVLNRSLIPAINNATKLRSKATGRGVDELMQDYLEILEPNLKDLEDSTSTKTTISTPSSL